MDIKELIALMKAEKITTIHLPDGTNVVFAPEAFAPAPPPSEAPEADNLDEVGKHGMTRRQQLELYQQVFEADFKDSP